MERESEKDSFKYLCRQHFNTLHGIFVTEGTTMRGQQKLLKFMKNIPEEVRKALPIDGRTLRPPAIKFQRRNMPPGEFTYFGIQNMFNYAGDALFDATSNEINLICNMDGVPLAKTTAGKKFWPILACVGEYPVFVVAAYEGPGQPLCANDYLRDFVDEIIKLTKNGCTIKNRVYKFRLRCLVCDSPATCFIIGCKQHGGYYACRRCKTSGKQITLSGVTVKGKPRGAIRYPDLDECPRVHEDFVEYAQVTVEPHVRPSVPVNCPEFQRKTEESNCIPDKRIIYDVEKEGFRLYIEDEDGEIRAINDDDCFDEDDDHDMEPGCPSTSRGARGVLSRRGQRVGSRRKRGVDSRRGQSIHRKYQFHVHPTILTEIPGFDIVKSLVLDVMHMVFLGVMKSMLERWAGTSVSDKARFKLSEDSLKLLSQRLARARLYSPDEFQRKPDLLKYLCSWKGTQFRQFLLYTGVVILLGIISDAQMRHFHLLVVAMRFMCRKLPSCTPDVCTWIVRDVAHDSRKLLQEFVRMGNDLYTENFSLYSLHHLPHIPDDYEEFEVPLDSISGFKFENTNGHVKRMINGHFKPLTQLENKVSSLIHTKMYARWEKDKIINSIEEYYEIPQLCSPMLDKNKDDDDDILLDTEVGRSLPAQSIRYTRFEEM